MQAPERSWLQGHRQLNHGWVHESRDQALILNSRAFCHAQQWKNHAGHDTIKTVLLFIPFLQCRDQTILARVSERPLTTPERKLKKYRKPPSPCPNAQVVKDTIPGHEAAGRVSRRTLKRQPFTPLSPEKQVPNTIPKRPRPIHMVEAKVVVLACRHLPEYVIYAVLASTPALHHRHHLPSLRYCGFENCTLRTTANLIFSKLLPLKPVRFSSRFLVSENFSP